MYNLLIIDDQFEKENRNTIYEFMFGREFDITCIDSEEQNILQELENKYYDCVILDNNLNSGLEKEAVISLVAEYNYPIIMVSNVREFTVREYAKDEVIDFISLKQYFTLRERQKICDAGEDKDNDKELISQALRDLQERIIYDIYTTRNYTSDESGKVVICHLSDIQFCDPNVDENAIRTLFSKLEEFIINRAEPIDLVVISGDIVFSGKKKEYNMAKEIIIKFRDKLKKQRKNVDILFVPGNHDYNYQCYWIDESDNYKLDEKVITELVVKIKEKHGDNEWDTKGITEAFLQNGVRPDWFSDFEASPFFLSNFCEFAYEITKEKQYMQNNFGVTNTRYLKRGFAFVGIDNAYKYHKNLKGDKRYIFELDSDMVKNIKPPLYSICIGHVDPRSLGYRNVCEMQEDRCNDDLYRNECSNSGQCQKWGDMQRLFKKVNSIIYLFGHKHGSDAELSKDKKMLFIGAASPTGASPSEKTVNIIEINKNETNIDVEIAVHRATAENIAYSKTNKYQYDIKTGEWENIH